MWYKKQIEVVSLSMSIFFTTNVWYELSLPLSIPLSHRLFLPLSITLTFISSILTFIPPSAKRSDFPLRPSKDRIFCCPPLPPPLLPKGIQNHTVGFAREHAAAFNGTVYENVPIVEQYYKIHALDLIELTEKGWFIEVCKAVVCIGFEFKYLGKFVIQNGFRVWIRGIEKSVLKREKNRRQNLVERSLLKWIFIISKFLGLYSYFLLGYCSVTMTAISE